MKRVCASLMLAAALAAAAPGGLANDIVEIRLRGYYFAEPANVRITVAVAPDPSHRTLRVEADGESMFQSSEVDLTAEDRRFHTVEFKNLAAGTYRLRAAVLSGRDVLGLAEQELIVAGR